MSAEEMRRAAARAENAAEEARRAADRIGEAAQTLSRLFEPGYGGAALQLIELLEAMAPVQQPEITAAARDVLCERERQIQREGWTPEHDDEHTGGEMALAAACYAQEGPEPYGHGFFSIPNSWPWDPDWWKPTTYRRNLIKAGALILAEIERLDRLGRAEANIKEGA